MPVLLPPSRPWRLLGAGLATPPTSYGGYGGNDPNATPKYSFEYPNGWKSEVPNKTEKGTQGIDSIVTGPRAKGATREKRTAVLCCAPVHLAGGSDGDVRKSPPPPLSRTPDHFLTAVSLLSRLSCVSTLHRHSALLTCAHDVGTTRRRAPPQARRLS